MSATEAKPMTKTEIVNALSDSTGLTKQQVNTFLDELLNLMAKNLQDGGPGIFNLPGILKAKVVRKAAQPEREGIDPFTKQPKLFKARPAQNSVKISPLKKFKDMV